MSSFQTKISPLLYFLILLSCFSSIVQSKCKKGCPLALASYYVWCEVNVTFIAHVLGTTEDVILKYNPSVPDKDILESFTRINVPFSCDCLNTGEFLGHMFQYKMQMGDTYTRLASTYYSNLTTVSWIQKFNSFSADRVPQDAVVNVPVNCSCGDSSIDKRYGIFLTYPLLPGDSLKSVAQYSNSTPALLQSYNPNVNFNGGSGIVFIPAEGISQE